MGNNKHGVVKIPTDGITSANSISARVADKAGIGYEKITELKGVVQMDKLDAGRALVLCQDPPPAAFGQKAPDPKSITLVLKSVPLP
jgi:hypothetical protein